MTLEYKLSFVLNGKEQKAFQDYLNKVDCSLNAVVPIMIREFLMNDNQVKIQSRLTTLLFPYTVKSTKSGEKTKMVIGFLTRYNHLFSRKRCMTS